MRKGFFIFYIILAGLPLKIWLSRWSYGGRWKERKSCQLCMLITSNIKLYDFWYANILSDIDSLLISCSEIWWSSALCQSLYSPVLDTGESLILVFGGGSVRPNAIMTALFWQKMKSCLMQLLIRFSKINLVLLNQVF